MIVGGKEALKKTTILFDFVTKCFMMRFGKGGVIQMMFNFYYFYFFNRGLP